MRTRPLGTSSLTVSAVGLGCNNFGRPGAPTENQEGTTAVVHAALDAGITLFDTADVYGKEFGLSERMLGEALRGRRDGVLIATKFGHSDMAPGLADGAAKGSRAYIRAAVEGSLARLGVDTIDLYQHHTPDTETPVEETLAALAELVTEGKVREIGNSNYDAGMLRRADEAARASGGARFVSAQNQYNLLERSAEDELLPAAEDLGVGFLPFFPLANGLFTGKFTRTHRPADTRIMRQRPHVADDAPWDAMEAFAAFAATRGIGMLEATIGWLLSRPALASVIAGATTPDQVRQNAAAGAGWQPTPADLAEIDALFPR
ncbi:MAG: aldo/keto reductase [Microbacteriaceae bacterium]|nr:aldo/keto reductase [Microbacteriaceae bacterium]